MVCISYAKLLRKFHMESTVELVVGETWLRFVHRIMSMGWNRLPKRVLYSAVGVCTAARRAGGASYKSNVWNDRQKVTLSDE
jgi:hypothetical protein